MENLNSEIIKEFYRVLHRFHQCKPKFKGDGDLANVEFFMLMGISALLDEKNGRFGYPECCDVTACNPVEKTSSEEIGITLGEIIKASEMSMSAASKKISIFEKKGYIKRETSKKDRRNVYITLTDKGKEICEKEKAKKHLWAVELISRMGDEDMTTLLKLANRVFDIMDEMDIR